MLRLPSVALADRDGPVLQAACPFSCESAGVPRDQCRQWSMGSRCFVQDLRSPQVGSGQSPQRPNPFDPVPTWSPYGQFKPWSGEGACRIRTGSNIAPPRINIQSKKRTGSNYDGTYRVRGSVEGVCLADAGYFENGKKEANIPITTAPKLTRREFEVRARGRFSPEIRVYNVNGDVAVVPILPDDTEGPVEEGTPRPPLVGSGKNPGNATDFSF